MPRTWNLDGGIHEVPLPSAVPGRLWLCGKHFIAPEPAAALERVGARTVVCLVQEHELTDRYPGYVGWLHAAVARGEALWFPIHDLHAPDLDQARPFYDVLASRLRDGDRVVVHCAAGIGRAGTTAVALLLMLGVALDDALATVAASRPMAGPEVGTQRALVNRLARDLASDD